MKDVQCYELYGGITLKNHASSFSFFHKVLRLKRWFINCNTACNAVSHVDADFLQPSALRPWGTKECSQPATWTMNLCLFVSSRAMDFPGRPTNSGSTMPRAAHQNGSVIGCHMCLHLAYGMRPGISRHATTPLARMLSNHHLHHCPHPTHHSHD